MFWNAYFEGAILKHTHVLKYIFWWGNFEVHPYSKKHFFEGTILMCTNVLKCIFWGRNCFNFLIHDWWLVWLLLYVFYQSFHHKQKYPQFDMYKYKSKIIVNWLQSSWVYEQGHKLRISATPSEIFWFSRRVLGEDQWCGMASPKSHRCCTVKGR